MTVWLRITVSLTRSCASTFSRVASMTSRGVSDTTAARSRKCTVCTSDGSAPRPIGPKRSGFSDSMTQ